MKKIICLLIVIFFVTGCKATYNVEIYNGRISEDIDFSILESTSKEDNRSRVFDLFVKNFDGVDMLSSKEESTFEKDNSFYYRISNVYNINNYIERLDEFKNCCRTIDFSNNGEFITFRTLGYFNWFDKYEDLDELNIVLKSNHKVKEHNADEVGKNTYTWHITKDNYKEKIPSIKLYSDKYVFDYNGTFAKKVLTIVGIVVIISLVSFVTYSVVSKRGNEANQI